MNEKYMDKIINEAIEPGSASSDARSIMGQIKDAEQIIADLNMRLAHMKEQLMASLGSEIRKRRPGMSIGLGNGRCSAGYKSVNMNLEPNVENGTWVISGGPFANRFMREFPHMSKMSDDISPLADAVSDFFSKRYKSLR